MVLLEMHVRPPILKYVSLFHRKSTEIVEGGWQPSRKLEIGKMSEFNLSRIGEAACKCLLQL